ncbi:MAG: hypothetical protein GYA36_22795 [Veillonellaceae bacterium]|nr:hypothetical protein [Veillonellaceae bacterium]
MFTEESGLVKTWVRLIEQKVYTIEDVPMLSNLKEMVKNVLERSDEK